MCAAVARAQAHLGLHVSTMQTLSPALQGTHDSWAQEQATHIPEPLRAIATPLSSMAFHTGMEQDLATQHTTQEAKELAQHVDREAREDHHDEAQMFKGQFRTEN